MRDVKMTIELCEQFNVQYKSNDYDEKLIGEFPTVEKNEEETALVLQSSREIVASDRSMLFRSLGNMFLWDSNRISYISDLHLMHRIHKSEDGICALKKIIDVILTESTSLTLIGGDLSSSFPIFEFLLKCLEIQQVQKDEILYLFLAIMNFGVFRDCQWMRLLINTELY